MQSHNRTRSPAQRSSEGGRDSQPLLGAAGLHLVGCTGTGATMLRQAVSYVDPSQQVFDLVFRYLRDVIPRLKPMGLQGLCRIQCLRLLMVNRSSKRELHGFTLDGVCLLLKKCIRDSKMRLTSFHNLRPPNAPNLADDDAALVNLMRRWSHRKQFPWQRHEAEVPAEIEKLPLASIVYRGGDISYITQDMVQPASRSIRNELATIRETNERLGLPRFPSMVCAGFMLNKRISRPVFTHMLARRSRSVPLVRASEPAVGFTRRSHSADELTE